MIHSRGCVYCMSYNHLTQCLKIIVLHLYFVVYVYIVFGPVRSRIFDFYICCVMQSGLGINVKVHFFYTSNLCFMSWFLNEAVLLTKYHTNAINITYHLWLNTLYSSYI